MLRRGRLIIRIVLAETAVAGQHIGLALGDRLVVALPHDIAALIDDRTPRLIAVGRGAAGRDAKIQDGGRR